MRCKKSNYDSRVKSLQKSWKAGSGKFVCVYSQVPFLTDSKDHQSPLYLSFDHRNSRDESEYIITCRLINDMKAILNDAEFKKVVIGLADIFKTETPGEVVVSCN